ncbi:hypothetical protein Tco_1462831 [Tanacetum coccineum]
MTGPVVEGDQEDQEESPLLTKEQLEGHISALKSLIKNHNKKNMVDPIRLDFKEEDTEVRENHVAKGKAVVDNDLKKPFKEAIRTPLTRRIIEFTGPETSRYNLLVADQKESGGIHRRYGDKKKRRKNVAGQCGRNLRQPQENQYEVEPK